MKADEDMPFSSRQVLQASARHWLARADSLDPREKSLASPSPDDSEDD